MRKRRLKKLLGCLLAFGMTVSSVPVSAFGTNADVQMAGNAAKAAEGTVVLTTNEMDVTVATGFPYIVSYAMKEGDLAGKTFFGQMNALDTIKINGQAIKVNAGGSSVTHEVNDAGTAVTYTMNLKGENIDCVITAVISVKENTASFDITKVENHLTEMLEEGYTNDRNGNITKGCLKYPVQSIEIPNHSLISVRSSQQNANLKGAVMSSNTRVSGDEYYDVTASSNINTDFIYAFLSNSEMSAGLWSNSEHEGRNKSVVVSAGGASNTRVMASTEKLADNTASVGLSSAVWYYDRQVVPKVVVGVDNAGTTTREARTYVVEHDIMPSAKVAIAGDENADNGIDWQDGAVAFRKIMHDPYLSEEVPELVNYRIAMNFGSMAANPFLTNLDGVKRVYLNTDGLGQGVLLKGYGSEGHDSGHPDYADIGTRIGGAEDMKTLMKEGKKMGALFGIHVNASEMYTEAKAFSNELSRGYDGLDSGWNWLDQGIGINGLFDLADGRRQSRFAALHEALKKSDGTDDLDFIYVDVWGNGVAGGDEGETSWGSRMLAREINGLGWRLATEWGPTHEYDSTLQHWAADLVYGGYNSKGENSAVMRFLRNHQKDSWVADYPRYDGAAQMPLLGGLNMTDFEGWQGRTDYDNYIKIMFRHNLITKYLQHYQVVDWVDGSPVSVPANESISAPAVEWTPEMQVTLRNTKNEADSTEIVVSRKSNNYADLANYRSRTITVNGVKVSEGAPTGGDGSNAGDEKYLIPWNWGADGSELSGNDMKMYHWNTNGGTSEWELTKNWQGLSNVVVYKLTDEGKTDKQVVDVVDNKITLTAEAEVPYVIYRGEKAPLAVDWQTSQYVYDMGFNDTDVNSHRTVTGSGTAEIADNISANNMLKLDGEVSVSTEITNLTAGQKYALYVGVDNRSKANAYAVVTSGGKTLGTNYAGESFVENIVSSDQHRTGNGGTTSDEVSYFQNMFVFFTADAATATLTLKRDAGEGATYFDDIRVVPSKMDVIREQDENGNITALYNDFENNVQGIWPFVVSGPKDDSGYWAASYYVTDNRIHLSEKHAPFSQAGYMTKAVDDVLDGNWSVKINGLTQNESVIYRTIPQNFHFIPGQTYYVSFDYQMGSDGTYEVRLGDGRDTNVSSWKLAGTPGQTQTFGCTFTAGESGNNWIGIYSTNVAADSHGLLNKRLDFAGYKDFILDNIKIEKGGAFLHTPESTSVDTAKDALKMSVSFADEKDSGAKVTWTSSDENVARVNEKGEVYFTGFGTAVIMASAAVIDGRVQTLSCPVAFQKETMTTGTFTGAWANTYNSDAEGPNSVTDRAASTLWHSQYNGFTVSEDNPAILTVQTQEEITSFERIAFRQRSGPNGLIGKYQCIIGKAFDEKTHTITEPTYTSEPINLAGTDGYKQDAVVEMEIPKGTEGTYLQIKVLNGNKGYAAMADVLIDTVVSRDTEDERAFMKANAALFEKKDENPDPNPNPNPNPDPNPNPNPAPDVPKTLQKGQKAKDKNNEYKVLDASKKTVTITKSLAKKSAKTIKIPAKVKVNGINCTVTAVAKNAFKGYSKVTSIVIPKNVTKIDANAFSGCKKLKKVEFKNAKVKIAKNAFKSAPSKATVKIPASLKKNKKKLSKFKTMLKSAGLKSAKIK